LSAGTAAKTACRCGRCPSGEQLRAIAALVDAGTIRPVIDRIFPFESTKDAMAYVESGRAKGKVVVTMADLPLSHPVKPLIAHTPATLTEIPFKERRGHD
jgi:zinc-binding alcohol dehydrogenase family protein